MLRNAHNVLITGGEFTNIENNITLNRKSDPDGLLKILWNHVAAGAMFDSAERYPPGRCHPGTRQRIIDRITEWINDADAVERILWLHGSAGAGKSAIMQSMCELLRDSYPDMYAGSFFFARGHADRGKSVNVFLTLAYQLAIRFSSVRDMINSALSQDPSVLTKSIDIQLRSLIIDPLLHCNDFASHPPILIIDGLDECDDDQGIDGQRNLISLISQSLIEHNIPIRFMIASRPEYWIRDTFEALPLSTITLSLSLRDDVDADRDIRAYLIEKFDKIRQENNRIMQAVMTPWPPKTIIDRLVEQASGQYLYASTVLKFVGKFSRFSNPQKQLGIMMNPGPYRASAFSELDRLYATILSEYSDRETMKRVLGGLLAGANLPIIEMILKVDSAETTLILDALRSLIEVSTPEPPSEYELLITPIFGSFLTGTETIHFCHLSFCEFLEDAARSGTHYVDVESIVNEITEAFFGIIFRNIDQNYETEPHTFYEMGIIPYRRMIDKMVYIVAEFHESNNYLRWVNVMTESLQDIHPGRRISYPACFVQDVRRIQDMSSAILKRNDDRTASQRRLSSPIFRGPEARRTYSTPKPTTLTCSFRDAVGKLQEIASLALDIGLRLVPLCDGFTITAVFLSINLLNRPRANSSRGRVSIQDLLAMPGNTVADILSSFQIYRHIIDVRGGFVDLLEVFVFRPMIASCSGEQCWFSLTEYRTQYVWLVCRCLKSMLTNMGNGWEDSPHLLDGGKRFIVRGFMDNSFATDYMQGHISDIQGQEYFDDESYVYFLQIMADSTAWMANFPFRTKMWTNLFVVVSPALRWLNRQLSNPNTIRLLEHHDASLPQKLKTTMNGLFQHCFLPIFTTPYFSELRISTSLEEENRKSIKIIVLSSSCFGEETTYSPPDDSHDRDNNTSYHWFRESFKRIQEQIFGMPNSAESHSTTSPAIKYSDWYPYLAAYLLNVMAKHLYCQANPGFNGHCGYQKGDFIEKEFRYISQCLPYARTSQKNLNTFRAILFFSRMTDPWNPPMGFCSLTAKFLKNYEHCGMSSKELREFELWLSDIQKLESCE